MQLERLLKSGTVVPASKLAETKELELQRVRDFEAAATDEERYRKAANFPPHEGIKKIPLTRERFEE
jgi:primosomal protein N'